MAFAFPGFSSPSSSTEPKSLTGSFSKIRRIGAGSSTFTTKIGDKPGDKSEDMLVDSNCKVKMVIRGDTLLVESIPTLSLFSGSGASVVVNGTSIYSSGHIVVGSNGGTTTITTSASGNQNITISQGSESGSSGSDQWVVKNDKPSIQSVSAEGSSTLNFESNIFAPQTSLTSQASSGIFFRFPSSADIFERIQANSCGSSTINLGGLTTRHIDVTSSGSSEIILFHVEKSAELHASGLSDISGTASAGCSIDKSKSGSADITVSRTR